MGAKTDPYPAAERQAATYWRRRFVALVIGLAILAVIAWAFSGALGGASAGGATAGSAGLGGHSGNRPAPRPAGRPAATGSGSPSAAAPTSAARSPSARASAGRQAKVSPGSAAAATGSSGGRRFCPGKDVVLSLFASQGSASRGSTGRGSASRGSASRGSASQGSAGSRALAQFDVDVVSTSPQTCKLNVGAKYLTLVISSGKARIWSSADCVRGQGSLVTDLRRGVPTVLPISWDRKLSAPGCAGRASQAPAGTYSATAADGALVSNSQTFLVR